MSREMKDSGIEWIGMIPKDWETQRIKHWADESTKNSFIDGDWIESPDVSDSGIRYLTTGNIGDGMFKRQGNGYITLETFVRLNCKYAYPKDLVISRLNAPYGRSCILPNDFAEYVLAVDNVILRTKESANFICYATQCDGYHKAVEDEAKGTTMKRISRTNLGNIIIPHPPLPEQQKIADYLDKVCGEANEMIALQEKMIDELKAYKQSVITEATTKGLNPNVPMKDSGIDWIGEIPEHWKLPKLKYITSKIGSGSTPRGGSEVYVSSGVKFIRSQNVFNTGLVLNDIVYITEAVDNEMKGTQVHTNDILFNITGGSIGRCYYVDETLGKANVNQHVSIVRPKGVNTKFLLYSLQSEYGQFQVKILQTGGNREGLAANAFKEFLIAISPLFEQQQIASYLDTKCSEIDSLIAIKQQKIEELKEYKKSIIYEYVSGKKEVV